MKTIVVVLATRPDAIKLAPLIEALNSRGEAYSTVVCSTGQHRELLRQVLDLFDLSVDYDLDVMQEDQSLESLTNAVLSKVSSALRQINPDLVIIQGDTTSALGASLAAFYQQVPVAHVEAGLRTRNRYRPFPEEMNRRIISALASLHFAPTRSAYMALLEEGYSEETVFLTGNTIVDALYKVIDRKTEDWQGPTNLRSILVTVHRRENHGGPLENVCNALLDLVRRNTDIEVLFPVHFNPRVRQMVYRLLGQKPRIRLIEPLNYEGFIRELHRSYIVLTDSGGVQEEAPALGKPVLLLRDETERPEGVEAGVVEIVGTDRERIVRSAEKLLSDKARYAQMSKVESLYGDGQAAKRIVDILDHHFPFA